MKEPTPQASRLPIKQLLLALGVMATLYAAVLLVWGDRKVTSLALLWSWTGVQAAGLCLLNYVLRGTRWRLWMAHFGRDLGWRQGLRLYLAGYTFTPTPGNVGEAVRGMMLADRPLGTTQSLTIFGAERLADFACLVLLCIPALLWALTHHIVQTRPGLLWVLAGAVVLLLALLASLFARYRQQLFARFDWLQQAWYCLSIRPFVWFALTITAWAAQGLAVWLICRALGMHMHVLTAMGFYAVAMVAGALSALPAGLGGMEAVLTGLLLLKGVPADYAVAITVLVRLLTLWLAVGIGVVSLFYSAAIRKDISFS
ncbi:MAG: lysylphosphatidylglycerol synthase transmembrane domain-containing protein [Pseudomonadota bacterium]